MPNPRTNSPVDEDLQRLYNDVWAGFAEGTPVGQREGDLDDFYKAYSSESAPPIPPKPHIHSSPDGSHNGKHQTGSHIKLHS